MLMKKIFTFKEFKESLSIAIKGLRQAFYKEQSFRIQVFIGILALILVFAFPLKIYERAIIFLTISTVLGFELLNSQIEKMLDIIQPNNHPNVKIIKDFSAGAVLLVCFISILVGLLIFLPYFLSLFR